MTDDLILNSLKSLSNQISDVSKKLSDVEEESRKFNSATHEELHENTLTLKTVQSEMHIVRDKLNELDRKFQHLDAKYLNVNDRVIRTEVNLEHITKKLDESKIENNNDHEAIYRNFRKEDKESQTSTKLWVVSSVLSSIGAIALVLLKQ